MQKELSKQKNYHIDYLADLLKAIDPTLIENAQSLIILSALTRNDTLSSFSSKIIGKKQSVYRDPNLKDGIPFFREAKDNIVVADFGKYLIRGSNQTKTSRQSMMNILYSFKLAKKIKILLILEQQWFLDPGLTPIKDTISHFGTTFQEKMFSLNEQSDEKDKTILDICNSVGFLILQEKKTNSTPQYYKKKLEEFIFAKALQSEKVSYRIIKSILENDRIIFSSQPHQKIWDHILAMPSFSMSFNMLKSYFRYNIKQPRNETEKQRKEFILNNIQEYMNKIIQIFTEINQGLPDLLSTTDNELIRSTLAQKAIAFRINNIQFKQKPNQQKIMLVSICNIIKGLANLCISHGPNYCDNSICQPGICLSQNYEELDPEGKHCLGEKIIRIFYRQSLICNVTNFIESPMYLLGYLIKMSFKMFSYLNQFNTLNIQLSTMIPQLFNSCVEHLYISYSQWIGQHKIKHPKTMKYVIKQIEKTIDILQKLPVKQCKYLEMIKDKIEEGVRYLKLETFRLRCQYLNAMKGCLKNKEKIDIISVNLQYYAEYEHYLTNYYEEECSQHLDTLYEILGDELVERNMLYFAIKLYYHASKFYKLRSICIKHLENKIDAILTAEFIEICQYLIQIGGISLVHNYGYKLLSLSKDEEQRKQVSGLIDSLKDAQSLTEQKFMGAVETQKIRKGTRIQQRTLSEIIQVLKESQKIVYFGF